jgi:hypothetical protein
VSGGAWNRAKVAVFKESFYDFLNCVVISSRDRGQMVLGHHLFRAQTMFYDTVFEGLGEDIHDFYCLKSRQLGLSTGTRALTTFWLGMHDGMRGAMVFDTARNTASARLEIEELIDGLPKRLKFPKIIGRNRDSLRLSNNSWLMFMQAGTKNSRSGGGLGRSLGLNLVHASEMSSWANAEGVTSFRQSLTNEYDDRLYIWESTARGYELWYNLWSDAKNDELNSRTLFIGWWAKDNQKFDRGTEHFALYGRDPPNKREIERIQAVKELYNWDITPEQLAWYRWKIDPARDLDEGDPEDSNLVQEQPWVEEEAFQQTGSSFFQAEKLAQASIKIANGPKPQAFKFWPNVDFVRCDMLPARTKREAEFMMWEEPAMQSAYVVAADPAFGHDEHNNNSCAQVLRCYADGIDQVGEYASATIQPHHFAWLLWTLVGYYGSSGSPVMMICEINGPGEEVWRQYSATRQIVQQGYLRAAAKEKGISDIFNNARTYIYSRSDSMSAGHSTMFKTTSQQKVQIMEATRNYLHNGLLTVYSMPAIEEMRTITRDGDQIGAEGSNRDDRTFALALGVRAWDERVRRGLIAGNRTREAERAKLSLSIDDQWRLFQTNQLANFFAKKATDRRQQQMAMSRASWRNGGRLAPIARRF